MADEKEAISRSVPSSPPRISHVPLPPREAPPAYESLVALLSGHNNSIRLPDDPPSSHLSSNHHVLTNPPSFFRPASRGGHTRSLSSSSVSNLRAMSWFPFSSSSGTAPTLPVARKSNNEVRTTVLNLVRDLVQDHSSGSSPAALGILQSCAEACHSHSVSLAAILQDKFIESHSPLYWAIVKRPQPDLHEDTSDITEPDLLDALLKQASPLNADTVTELRQACLATSDHLMFQRLRILPQFTATSGADKVILGATLPPDDITVELGPGNEGAFAVKFEIFQFHKRMMVSKEITHEFVARNRIWKFSFLITPENAWYGPPPGSWCVSLSLQEFSPPTWFDGSLILLNSDKPLHIRSKQMMEAPRNDIPAIQITVAMADSPDFATLQYSDSTFIPDDEKLSMRLEAKLRNPHDSYII